MPCCLFANFGSLNTHTLQDELWETEYNVLQQRFEDNLVCYENEKKAHSEKMTTLENTVKHLEDLATCTHTSKAQIGTLRLQVTKHRDLLF